MLWGEIYLSNINHNKLIVFISLVNRYEHYIMTTKSSCKFLDFNKTLIKSYNEFQQFALFPCFLHEILYRHLFKVSGINESESENRECEMFFHG